MENEELFAGEPALDAQQQAADNYRPAGASRQDPLQIHTEPLLAGDDEWQQQQHEERVSSIDERPRWRRPHIWWLLPFGLLFTLGFGGLAVPRINLIMSLICRDYFAEKMSQDPNFTYLPVIFGEDNSQCRLPEIQSLVAKFQLYLNLVTGIISALVSPRLGHLSDRYGRTTMISLCAMGAVFNEAITATVASWPENMSVNILLVGAVMDGLGGSFTTAQALIHSYASDCTPPDRRSVAFGMFHGALFLGIAAGPTGAAYLISKTGNSLIVFYIGLAFHTFFCFSVYFIVPESLSKERQLEARERHRAKEADLTDSRKFSLKALNPLNLITPLKILMPAVGKPSVLFPNRRGASPALRRNIVLLAAMDTAVFGVAMGTVQVIIIYAEYMFNWGNVESSLFVSIINAVRVVNLFLVLPVVARLFRTPSEDDGVIRGSDMLDIVLIRLSVVFDILGYVGYALSKHPSVMILSGAVASLGGMGSPTLQSSLTKHVPHDRVGQMLGATGLLHALARVVAPTIFNLIYSMTVATYPQTVFVSLAAVFGIVFILGLFIQPHVTLDDKPISEATVEANEEGESEDDRLLI
ncbi:putative MFS transporter [Penicillium brasilianum]|uniref:Putative MFS transporter n=1 Tax=Penicillium brasilianum TaxID=104259 RepID=A0A1S9RUV7_PENBI|nr:putative MFS transporter [Penicillium brasilianum]